MSMASDAYLFLERKLPADIGDVEGEVVILSLIKSSYGETKMIIQLWHAEPNSRNSVQKR